MPDRTVATAELASYLGLDRSSVSGLVERAEKRGLVRRAPRVGDGRGVQVGITDHGQRLAVQLRAAVTPRLTVLAAPLSPKERSVLTALLVRTL